MAARSEASHAWYLDCLEQPGTADVHQALLTENPPIFVSTTGKITSRFRDDSWLNPATGKYWFWTVTGKNGCSLYPEARFILFHILFHPDFCERSLSTVTADYYWLRLLCRECEKAGFASISLFFSDDRASRLIVDQLCGNRGERMFTRRAATIINKLFRIDKQLLGFEVVKGSTYADLCEILSTDNKETFQHPPIPWRQYRALIHGVAVKLQEYLQLLEMDGWIETIRFHHEYGRQAHGTGGGRTGRFVKENFPSLANVSTDFRDLRNLLNNMIDMSRIAIMVFTGCRIGETNSFGPKEADDRGDGVFLVYGRTTKTGQKQTYWVTNEIGASAIRLALKVRDVLAAGLEVGDELKRIPLFPSFHDYPANIFRKRAAAFDKRTKSMSGIDTKLRDANIDIPRLDKTDIQFLVDLSTDSNVDLTKFKKGNKFRITSHQFRRSLIYYAMRSGDIEIGAFKLQFKHWQVSMTEYYSSGVHGLDGATNKTMSMLVEYEYFAEIDERLRHHIAGFDRLAGGIGASINKNISSASEERQPHLIERTREQMLRRAKQGEINYSRTPLGACTSTKPCISRAQSSVSACLGCRSAVLQVDKVKGVHDALLSSAHPFFSSQAEHFSQFLLGQKD